MAVVTWTNRARADLDRVIDFLLEHNPQVAAAATENILDGTALLARHPLIGRSVEHGLRELVISYGRAGYVALYDFDELGDQVLVLALRHQREAGSLARRGPGR